MRELVFLARGPHHFGTMLDALSAIQLERLIQNLLRRGVVAQVDATQALARVKLGVSEDAEFLTGWLPWLAPAGVAAGESTPGVSCWSAPAVGEPCLVLAAGGDISSGVILRGLYSQAHPAPENEPGKHRMTFGDGAWIGYDEGTHELTAVLPADATASIEAPGGITLKGDTIIIEGKLHVTDDAQFDGKAVVEAEIEAADALLGPTQLAMLSHVHVASSLGSPTTPPQAGGV